MPKKAINPRQTKYETKLHIKGGLDDVLRSISKDAAKKTPAKTK